MKKVGVLLMIFCLCFLVPLSAEGGATLQSGHHGPALKANPDTDRLLLAKKGEGKDPAGWKKRREAQDENLERKLEQKEGEGKELLEKREQKWDEQEDKWRKKRERLQNRIKKIEKEEQRLKKEKEALGKELETMEKAGKEG